MASNDLIQDVLMVLLPGSYADELISELERHGVDVRTSDGLFKLLNGIGDGGVPDVVHLHFLHGFFVVESRLLTVLLGIKLVAELCVLRVLGAPVVWTVHNLTEHENRHPRLEYAVRHVVARLCDRVIVHCDRAGDIITDTYRLPRRTQDRIRTVPHGNYKGVYPDEVSDEQARAELNLSDEFVYLFFGQIRPYKQVDTLIKTFQRLNDPNVRLLIIGDPANEELEARLASLAETDDRIRTVFEFVPGSEVQYYHRAADVTVLPYRSILTSGSIILTMTFGRPAIAPNIGCVQELLDESGGFPYNPDREDALFHALRRAKSTSLDGMGAYNQAMVRNLDWESLGRRTLRIYEQAATDAD